MSFIVTEKADGRIIEVDLTGKLSKQAYDELVPLTERRLRQYGKVRMLVVMSDFHGWEAGALWEDVKFDLKHFRDIERLALVGDSKWEKGMAMFCKPFTTAQIKYFSTSELQTAQAWIAEEP